MIVLYKKTHRKTGLQYLGKTTRDPYKYQGSGRRWSNHINKHGYDVETEILLETDDPAEIEKWGIYYSNLWNVVESKDWANLKVEQGDGGWDHVNRNLTSEEYARRGRKGRKNQDEYFIKNYGSLYAGRIAISNRAKGSETYKKNYRSNPELQRKTKENLKKAGEQALSIESRQKRLDTFQSINHQQGEKNSQFGTCWITNGIDNKKVKKEDVDNWKDLGYTKGRKV
jgi:hypothetical protein